MTAENSNKATQESEIFPREGELRERLITRTTEPGAVDRAAAAEVREQGFSRELDG